MSVQLMTLAKLKEILGFYGFSLLLNERDEPILRGKISDLPDSLQEVVKLRRTELIEDLRCQKKK